MYVKKKKTSNLHYADDILWKLERKKMNLVSKIDKIIRDIGLKINTSKTKIMIINRLLEKEPCPVSIDSIKIVKNFMYLDTKISHTGSCENKKRRKIAMGKAVVSNTYMERSWDKQENKTATNTHISHCNLRH